MLLHRLPTLAKLIGYSLFAAIILFLLTRYFTFWLEWPSISNAFQHLEGSAEAAVIVPVWKQYGQLAIFALGLVLTIFLAFSQKKLAFYQDAKRFSAISAYVVRAAYWSVLLIGIADAVISLARIEGWLIPWFGAEMAESLGRAQYRGSMVHFPLIGFAFVIAFFQRSLSFVWLSLLVILAEFAIVLARFVFSYEQTFMGDLVRFWYAALFLFASAYTLLQDAHVRVDVLFANLSRRSKAWVNTYGSLFLGLPVCGVILWLGMATKQSSLLAPVLNFEISQSGYGMYVKYLMSLFLVVFAVTMAIQFISYFFAGLSILRDEQGETVFAESEEHV